MTGSRAGRVFALILVLAAAATANAQQHPNIERGLMPDKAYQLSDVDVVNLFNGVVNVAIPLGVRYPVGGNLSYQFALSYATNTWESAEKEVVLYLEPPCEEPCEIIVTRDWTYPERATNAGFGWSLSFGSLLLGRPAPFSVIYRSPDGGDHKFYDKLHELNPNETFYQGTSPQWVRYTRDGSYLRLRKFSDRYELDLPNGDVHTFGTDGKLRSMTDRYGNEVTIAYGTRTSGYPGSTVWTISDTTGREHYVHFRPGAHKDSYETIESDEIVDFVDLAAFDGTRAVYQFRYQDDDGTPRSTIARRLGRNTDPEMSPNTVVSLLAKVELPFASEQLDYGFTYYADNARSGNLSTLKLPTGATVHYSYVTYDFQTAAWGQGAGLRSRKITSGAAADGEVLSWTDYQPESFADGTSSWTTERRIVSRKDGDGNVLEETRHYFSTCKDPKIGGCETNVAEYALPFTRAGMPAGGPFLSTETVEPAAPGTIPQVKRSTYVRYEGDIKLDASFAKTQDFNRRLSYSRTTYEDGTYVEKTLSNFDGLGNYRTSVTGGTNPQGGNVVKSVTNFNPLRGTFALSATGTYNGNFSMVPVTSPWILGTYDKQQVTEDGKTSTAATCFDTNGFLTIRRTYRAFGDAPAQDGKDLLAIFTADAQGNLAREQLLGGDTGVAAPAIALTPPCVTGSQSDNYRMEHRYESGTRKASYATQPNGTPLSHFLLDADVDANTGLLSARRTASTPGTNGASDGGGLRVEMTYDLLGRLVREGPPPAANATARGAARSIAFSQSSKRVEVAETTANGVTTLRRRILDLDALGRVRKEIRTIPGTATASRIWEYDELGRIMAYSAWGNQDPPVLTLVEYDALGRMTRMTAPDGGVTSYAYTGGHLVEQTARIQTTESGAPADALTTMLYDAQGHLRRVTEPGGVTTRYDYDVGGRLERVCAAESGASCGQTRSFQYDNRGFLTSEQMPELGASGNGTASYTYDAKGNVVRKTIGAPGGPFDVESTYDRAGRLERVYENRLTGGVQRTLKSFQYGTNNAGLDFRNGQMTRAVRFNWLDQRNVQIIEDYVYAGRDGAVSARTTYVRECSVPDSGTSGCNQFTPGTEKRRFVQEFAYDELGAVTSLTQPQCDSGDCGAAGLPVRSVTNTYEDGFLTSVNWTSAPRAATLTYHDNGMLHTVTHANQVVDTILLDPETRVPRPHEITTTNVVDPSACVAPSFSAQPQSVTVTSGSPTTLRAVAQGQTGAAITYSWYEGTSPNESTRVHTETLQPNVESRWTTSLSTTTSYWVKAANACGAASSSTAVVTVCVRPSIAQNPKGKTVTRTQSHTLSVTATGDGPLSYQWQRQSGGSSSSYADIAGAVAREMTVTPDATTTYRVRVTNDCGAATSTSATVTVVEPPTAPDGLVVATSNGSVNTVTWPQAGSKVAIARYEIQRKFGPMFSVQMPGALVFSDGPSGLTAATAYLYRVRAVDENGVAGPWSAYDVTTTMSFADDPLQAGITPIRGIHVGQLRRAIDALRAAAGLPPVWSSYAAATGPVRLSHLTQMRAVLSDARASLGLPPMVYAEPNLTAGQSPIKASHYNELRQGVK